MAARLALTRFVGDERGATAVEYGLILALMFLAIVGSVQLFASNAGLMFERIREAITGAMGGA